MKGNFLFCLAIVGALALSASTSQAQTAPTTRGAYVWQFNDYLKGTAEELRYQINHEVERLAGNLVDARKEIVDDKKKIEDLKAADRRRVDDSPEAQGLQVTLAQLGNQLKAARETGTDQEKLDASAKYVACKQQIETKENAAIKGDAALAALEKRIVTLQQSLPALSHSIGAAEKWRSDIVEAIKTSAKIQWPLTLGKSGILGTVTIKQVLRDNTFVASCIILERQAIVSEGEGISSTRFLLHSVDALVRGIDTDGLHPGEKIDINNNVTVVTSVGEGEAGMPVLERTKAPIDQLLHELDSLKTPLTAAEMKSFLELSEKKDNPKTWTTVQQLVEAFPAALRANYASPWTQADLQKMNDWLTSNLTHDNLDATVIVQIGRDSGVGSFAIICAWPSVGSSVVHTVELSCPDSLKDRARTLRPGTQLQVKGKIDWVQMGEDSRMYIKVVDVSF